MQHICHYILMLIVSCRARTAGYSSLHVSLLLRLRAPAHVGWHSLQLRPHSCSRRGLIQTPHAGCKPRQRSGGPRASLDSSVAQQSHLFVVVACSALVTSSFHTSSIVLLAPPSRLALAHVVLASAVAVRIHPCLRSHSHVVDRYGWLIRLWAYGCQLRLVTYHGLFWRLAKPTST